MSRSNPSENTNPNPATRWFGGTANTGSTAHMTKRPRRTSMSAATLRSFCWISLGSVHGWHDASDSGITRTQVKDTRQDALVVKAFKGGNDRRGHLQGHQDRVNVVGGQFVASCYIAFNGRRGALAIGSLRLKGAALGAWMEFRKSHRADPTEGHSDQGLHRRQEGEGRFPRAPNLSTKEISPETDAAAIALDTTLQEFFAA
mgnify:CR=1 FL=1